jgi:hypothetical protein
MTDQTEVETKTKSKLYDLVFGAGVSSSGETTLTNTTV